MRFLKPLKCWTAGGLRALTLLAGLSVPAAVAFAQTPPVPPAAAPAGLPKITFTKNPSFDLPIVMDDKTRAGLKSVCLYVKTPTSVWSKYETAPTSATKFAHRVPQDGEYWFSLVTVDRNERPTPADVNLEPPGLRVVVDTQAPQLKVEPWTGPDGEVCLRCTMQDANPAPDTLKAVCKTSAGDVPLEPVAGQPGMFRVKGTEQLSSPVRITCADLAGNLATKEVNVRDLQAKQNQPAPPSTAIASTPMNSVASLPANPPVNPPMNLPANLPLNPPANPVASVSNKGPSLDPVQPAAKREVLPDVPPAAPAPGPLPMSVDPPRMVQPPVPPVDAGTKAAPANRQIINTTHAHVEYRIDQVGPSGVGKVEVYMTPDHGQSWQKLREDTDRKSPAEVDLPGDGVFGIRLAITNGNGFGGTPPKTGDTAHCWIEVDTTSPFVQLKSADLSPTSGSVELRWTASDKNLSAEPITLYYRTAPTGPWQLIVRNVKNDGVYRWTFPRDAGSQFFFRVEATDTAGNVGRVETPTPLVLDVTEPRASVIGVVGTSQQPHAAPQNGN